MTTKLNYKITFIVCMILCMVSCVNVPIADKNEDLEAKSFSSRSDRTTIYFFEYNGTKATINIVVNGKDIGPINNSTFYKVEVLYQSEIVLKTSASSPHKLVLPAERGKVYFVEVRSVLDKLPLGSYIFVMDEEENAKKEILKSQLIKSIILE